MKWIADENFPFPAYQLLCDDGLDIIHVGTDFPSITDPRVIEIAREESRILLTFDRDHGDLIFTGKARPPIGVVYFRLRQYRPDTPGKILLELIGHQTKFERFFTVVKPSGIKQRLL